MFLHSVRTLVFEDSGSNAAGNQQKPKPKITLLFAAQVAALSRVQQDAQK